MAIDRAEQTGLARAEQAAPAARELAVAIAVLAAATGNDEAAIGCLHGDEVVELLHAWRTVQQEHTPHVQALQAQLRLAVVSDAGVECDGAAAHATEHVTDYYGVPMTEITLGQLAYYMLLKLAYHEMHVEAGGRKVSRRWLEQQAMRAQSA